MSSNAHPAGVRRYKQECSHKVNGRCRIVRTLYSSRRLSAHVRVTDAIHMFVYPCPSSARYRRDRARGRVTSSPPPLDAVPLLDDL